MTMRGNSDIRLPLLAALLLASAVCGLSVAGEPPRHRVSIDGKTVDQDVVDGTIRMRHAEMGIFHQTPAGEPPPDLVAKVLDDVAARELFCAAAREEGMAVTDAETGEYVEGVGKRYGGIEKYRNYLESIAVPFDTYRKIASRTLLASKYARTLAAAKGVVTDEMVSRYYRENIRQFSRPGVKTLDRLVIEVLDNSAIPGLKALFGALEAPFVPGVASVAYYRTKILNDMGGKATVVLHEGVRLSEDRNARYWKKIEGVGKGYGLVFRNADAGPDVFHFVHVTEFVEGEKQDLEHASPEIRRKLQNDAFTSGVREKLEELKQKHKVAIETTP